MDTYYTIEEKYLQAVEEMNYGEAPKSLKLLNEILSDEPLYVRAHFQIGKLYYYDLKDYKAAGYHFKLCTELEPSFPDVYYHYIKLLGFLNMDKQLTVVANNALKIAGVYTASVYNQMGLSCENGRKWNQAIAFYNEALMQVTDKHLKDELEENLERIKFKMNKSKVYNYQICG